MRHSAGGTRPLCDVQSHTESNIDMKSPPIVGGQIVTTGYGPFLCTIVDVLRGSQRFDLPR
jgi:hypothetical protein